MLFSSNIIVFVRIDSILLGKIEDSVIGVIVLKDYASVMSDHTGQ